MGNGSLSQKGAPQRPVLRHLSALSHTTLLRPPAATRERHHTMAMAGPDVPLLGKTDHDESQDERNTTAHAVDATVEGHGAPWWRSGLRTAAVVLTLAAVGYTAYTSGVITSTAAPTTSLSEEGSDYFFSVDVSNE